MLGGTGDRRSRRNDDVYLETHQFGRKCGQVIEFSFCKSPLDDDVLPFDVPKLAEPLSKCIDAAG